MEENVVPAILQSEVLAKCFEEIGEKCGKILAKFFADFRPSISRENGRKKIHEKSSTFFPRCTKLSFFFHCCNSGGLGAMEENDRTPFADLLLRHPEKRAFPHLLVGFGQDL